MTSKDSIFVDDKVWFGKEVLSKQKGHSNFYKNEDQVAQEKKEEDEAKSGHQHQWNSSPKTSKKGLYF